MTCKIGSVIQVHLELDTEPLATLSGPRRSSYAQLTKDPEALVVWNRLTRKEQKAIVRRLEVKTPAAMARKVAQAIQILTVRMSLSPSQSLSVSLIPDYRFDRINDLAWNREWRKCLKLRRWAWGWLTVRTIFRSVPEFVCGTPAVRKHGRTALEILRFRE